MASNGVDFISNMPDPILQLILEGLPNTEEVVRTSVLLTRWRYLWTSIPYFPSLNLDCDRLLEPYFYFHEKKFEDFVTWCLSNKTVGLDSFRLCCSGYYRESTVNVWIKAAVNRNVKSLDLSFYPKIFMNYVLPVGYEAVTRIHLPHCLITCESLESLRLFAYQNIISLPPSSGFLGLKVLELNMVYCYDHDLVTKFLEMCVVLEELSLIECVIRTRGLVCFSSSSLNTLRIVYCNLKNVSNGKNVGFRYGFNVCCPELVIFEYVGHRCELILEDVNSLNKAVIHPKDTMQQKISPTYGKAASKLLAGISHVDSLSLDVYIIQCIHAARDPCDRKGKFPAYFPNLKTLELSTTIDSFTMDVLIPLLRCSPNLESLHLIIQKDHFLTECWVLNKDEARRILTRHLKRVKFLGFNGEKPKLAIACFLLKHGNALEEMVFSWSNKLVYKDKSMETMNELSNFYKDSSTVKLTTLVEDS